MRLQLRQWHGRIYWQPARSAATKVSKNPRLVGNIVPTSSQDPADSFRPVLWLDSSISSRLSRCHKKALLLVRSAIVIYEVEKAPAIFGPMAEATLDTIALNTYEVILEIVGRNVRLRLSLAPLCIVGVISTKA
jgi:hypothetical protein